MRPWKGVPISHIPLIILKNIPCPLNKKWQISLKLIQVSHIPLNIYKKFLANIPVSLKQTFQASYVWTVFYLNCLPQACSTNRALQRMLVSVTIALLNDSERPLNKKWLRPVTNKSNPPLVGNQSVTPSYVQLKLFHFINPHKGT